MLLLLLLAVSMSWGLPHLHRCRIIQRLTFNVRATLFPHTKHSTPLAHPDPRSLLGRCWPLPATREHTATATTTH
uniref:Putative secreted protein n=1 Tax=Anopheles darlingi TaxID=43151 RepID=A0A2M4DGV0_ANODA